MNSIPPGWEVCSQCRGYMVYMNGEDIADCNCWGGLERKRDAKGRFVYVPSPTGCSNRGHDVRFRTGYLDGCDTCGVDFSG